jgi:hypothetical protein
MACKKYKKIKNWEEFTIYPRGNGYAVCVETRNATMRFVFNKQEDLIEFLRESF